MPAQKRPSTLSCEKALVAFLIGFLVVLFELPCTGGPYFFVLGLLAQKLSLGSAVSNLLLYDLFFAAPLLVLTVLIYWGISTVEKAAEWKERNMRVLHLIAGIVTGRANCKGCGIKKIRGGRLLIRIVSRETVLLAKK